MQSSGASLPLLPPPPPPTLHEKPLLRVRFSEPHKHFAQTSVKKYYNCSIAQFFDLFLCSAYAYTHVPENEAADICIVDIQHTDNALLRDTELNVFVSIENMSVGRQHYQHWNRFGRYGNPKIGLYYYNDLTAAKSDRKPYAIPLAMKRIEYFQRVAPTLMPQLPSIPFSKRKFCLFTSRNLLNDNKKAILAELSALGKIDLLQDYDSTHGTTSCYNSVELLALYREYKFIVCFENSNTNGYITEKIFNVFLAGAIPIYNGAPDVHAYINRSAYIEFDDHALKKVMLLMSNENMYNHVVNAPKIVETTVAPLIQDCDAAFENARKYHEFQLARRQSPTPALQPQTSGPTSSKKCYICGCAKNCAPHIKAVFANIHKLGMAFDEYRIIVAYDTSSDDTLQLLSTEAAIVQSKRVPRCVGFDILIGPSVLSVVRTENISRARNAILDRIRELDNNCSGSGSGSGSGWDYFMMIDLDDVCSYPVNPNAVARYLDRNDWDAISYNRVAYYDTWALSYDPFVLPCWLFFRAREIIPRINEDIKRRLSQVKPGGLLEVMSAFNGAAIYRKSKFINCAYDWRIPEFTVEQMNANQAAIGDGGSPMLTRTHNDDCEHRPFHFEARRKNGARIMISPMRLFDN